MGAAEKERAATRSPAETELEACHGLLSQLHLAEAGPDGQRLGLLERLKAIFDPLTSPELPPFGRAADRLTEPESLAARVAALERQLQGQGMQLETLGNSIALGAWRGQTLTQALSARIDRLYQRLGLPIGLDG